MHPTNCLNCDTSLSGKFCSNCGQKADTHRITFKHFIMHDVLHGVWHFEKGMLFTAKEALTRPGKAALDYISGKRIRYYNVFFLILLLIGLNIFISHYYDHFREIYTGVSEGVKNSNGRKIAAFMSKYAKLIIFSFVPFFAFNGYLAFRRKKLNLSEHFIVAGILFLGILIIETIGSLLTFFDFTKHFGFLSDIASMATALIIFVYIIYSYYSAFKENYSKAGFSIRMILFLLLLFVELIIMLFCIVGFATNWKFGDITYQS
ncbi:MAG TPA: DUF3667 domain-containing protein [Flavobacterium sp.]|uniref:DUF3667 domain-containing protein n=1 Tax=Flavobacterium sp. TaxID=239 RepID=UPI002D09D28B|nr:DUF3667 domain-containing protein [Flavobacterium sp.]HSD13861.1 DUF3667 domain-containing protein [Flavobacterium sp.]